MMIQILLFSSIYAVLSLPLFRIESLHSALIKVFCVSGRRGYKRLSSTKMTYFTPVYYVMLVFIFVASLYASYQIINHYYSTIETWYTFLIPLAIPVSFNTVYHFVLKK